MPTAPEILPTDTISSRARSTRSRSRCSSAYHSASFTPKVIGSACTPCVRPIIGVRRCSSARARTASIRPATSLTIRSQAWRICSACAVSTTSEEVRPKCSQRAAGPTFSATAVVKAMTSCCVVCSISSMRAMSKPRVRAQLARGVRRDDAGLRHRVGGRELDLEPGLVAALLAPDRAHLGVGVARNHVSRDDSADVDSQLAIRESRRRRPAIPATVDRVRAPSPPAIRSRTDRARRAGRRPSVTRSTPASVSSRPKCRSK